MRIIVDLPDHQVAALAEFCAREHISQAEAVRRALDVLLSTRQTHTSDAAFGGWAPGGDGRATVEDLRKEWLP